MANLNRVFSIIVPAETPVLSGHTYTQIYGGKLGCTPTVNGIVLNIGPSSTIDLSIRTISNGGGCYLLGHNHDVYSGSNTVG
jgi:hypothetical protein